MGGDGRLSEVELGSAPSCCCGGRSRLSDEVTPNEGSVAMVVAACSVDHVTHPTPSGGAAMV